MSDRFRVAKEDGGPLSRDKRSGRGVHSFLVNLASRVDPVPGFERVVLLQFDPDGTVHFLHSIFSVLVDLYSMDQRIFAFWIELPLKGIPPVVELPVDAFSVRRSVHAVPRSDHISHMEGVSPSAWQAMPCEIVEKAAEGGHDLTCRGFTFFTLGGASRLIDTSLKIAEVGQLLFSILIGQLPPFEETLD